MEETRRLQIETEVARRLLDWDGRWNVGTVPGWGGESSAAPGCRAFLIADAH